MSKLMRAFRDFFTALAGFPLWPPRESLRHMRPAERIESPEERS